MNVEDVEVVEEKRMEAWMEAISGAGVQIVPAVREAEAVHFGKELPSPSCFLQVQPRKPSPLLPPSYGYRAVPSCAS